MNRTEAINQLNLEKKRRENAVWEQWFATESSGNVTSARLQKRTADIRQIQNWYDDAVFKTNNTPIKEAPLPQAQTIQTREEGLLGQQATRPQNTTKNQQQTQSQQLGRQVQQSRIGAQKTTPNDDILKGAENLPENKPINLGREAQKRNVDGIQSSENRRNEPSLVREAREQNRSSEVREAQNQEETQESDTQEQDDDTREAEQKKSGPKLSVTECFILLLFGIVSDLINLIPFVNILVSLFVTPVIALYFRMKKLPVGASVVAGIIELIPGLSVIPAITFGIIITILIDRFAPVILEKVPFASEALEKIPLAKKIVQK